jgi:hypothetical protein
MNIIESKGPKLDSCGTADLTTYKKERIPEI